VGCRRGDWRSWRKNCCRSGRRQGDGWHLETTGQPSLASSAYRQGSFRSNQTGCEHVNVKNTQLAADWSTGPATHYWPGFRLGVADGE